MLPMFTRSVFLAVMIFAPAIAQAGDPIDVTVLSLDSIEITRLLIDNEGEILLGKLDEQYASRVVGTLKKLGFSLSEPNPLFEESKVLPARYQMGGWVLEAPCTERQATPVSPTVNARRPTTAVLHPGF